MSRNRRRTTSNCSETSHSVFTSSTRPREDPGFESSCPQCLDDNANDNSGQPRQAGNHCGECRATPSQRRNRSNAESRQQRRRSRNQPNNNLPQNQSSSGPENLEGSGSGSVSRASRSRSRSRQRRQRRRARRMAAAAAAAAAASSNPTNSVQNNSGQNNAPQQTVVEEEIQGPLTPEEEAQRCQIRQWPHSFSFLFACLSCTLGMFSISRFAILTIDFGVIFLIQFLLLSLCFGIPLMTFHVSLGQYLGSGVIDMWRISPIHQGIGVALMLAQGLYGIYNIAAISWLFVYFRDSFITAFDRYRWSLCYPDPKYGRSCLTEMHNNTWRLEETLPDYFSGNVLLRSAPTYPQGFTGELRFQTLFYIVVIWMAVFIGLSKGLKSYGKVVFVFGIFPIVGFLVFATKVIGLLPLATFKYWFFNTQWLEFIYNGNSWICAARECFFTWCILGATLSQLASHNKFGSKLLRDTTIIVVTTLTVLILSGITGVAIVNLIRQSGYEYTVSSFETSKSYEFLYRRTNARLMRGGRDFNLDNAQSARDISSSLYDVISSLSNPGSKSGVNYPGQPAARAAGIPAAFQSIPGLNPARERKEHISFLAGIRIIRDGRNPDKYSGYQAMRLATELVPAYASILGPRLLSPFWVVLFYFSQIVFGLGQQMALFHTVSSGLIAIRPDHFLQFESSLTFMSCLLGLVFCFPLATEFGAFIVYFFDYTIGCGWWLMVLYVFQLCAIFVIRGKPYSGENIATALIPKSTGCCYSWLVPMLAFTWNVILPVGLTILSVVSFRWCRFAEMFDWTTHSGYLYLPAWVREIGAMMQLLPLLLVPFVGVIQSCRYFLNSQGELHERINMLYRPSYTAHMSRSPQARSAQRRRQRRAARDGAVVLTHYNPDRNRPPVHDPPPKYTPPPSYSTATGARIARFLRQSFRQSIRRFRGESAVHNHEPLEEVGVQDNPQVPSAANVRGRHSRCKVEPQTFDSSSFQDPPDYATVIIETSRHSQHPDGSYGSFNRPPCSAFDQASSILSSGSEMPLVESQLATATANPATQTTSFRSSSSLRTSDQESLRDHPRSLGRTTVQSKSFKYSSDKSKANEVQMGSESITISNAEPLDTISTGHGTNPKGAKKEEDTFYSVPLQGETDNAVSEYTTVHLGRHLKPHEDEQKTNQTMSETDLEIYSAASTLSLGETVILSDGLNRLTSSDLVYMTDMTSLESTTDEPVNPSEEQLPRNLTITIPPNRSNSAAAAAARQEGDQPVLTFDMDTTASVI